MKTTSPEDFSVSPSQGILLPNSDIAIKILFKAAPGSNEKSHRFLIQALATKNPNVQDINWSDPAAQSFKLSAVMEREERGSIYIDSRQSLFSNASTIDILSIAGLERQREKQMDCSKELTFQIDKLKSEVEKARHRLTFSKDMEIINRGQAEKGYSMTSLIFTVVLGAVIGAFFMA